MQLEHIKLLNVLNLSEQYVISTFGIRTVQRGISYFQSGRIRLIKANTLNNESIEINAEASGSNNNLYETTVTLISASNNSKQTSRPRVESDCDCPVTFQCKHGLATLLEFAKFVVNNDEELQQQNQLFHPTELQSPVDNWLHQLNKNSSITTVQPKSSPKPKQNILLYVLSLSEDNSGILQLKTYKAKKLQSGAYGKASKQDLAYLGNEQNYHNLYYENSDREVAHILIKKTNFPYYSYDNNVKNSYELEGDLGLFALKKILQTQRCFWNTIDEHKPLSEGNNRSISFNWKKENDAYEIHKQVLPKIDIIFLLDNLFYVDLKNRQIGELINHDLNHEQIINLLSAPAIPDTEAEKVSMQLLKKWPNAAVPLPVDLGIKEIAINNETAIPNCLLSSYEITDYNSSNGKRQVHLLKLRFKYADYLIEPEERNNYFIDIQQKNCLKIQRQLDQEKQAITTLQQFNFVSLTDLGEYGTAYEMLIYNDSELATVWEWLDFQQDGIPELEQQGWEFIFDESFSLNFDEADQWYAEINPSTENTEEDDNNQWFSMNLGIEINDKKINLLPTLVELLASEKSPQALKEKLENKKNILLPLDDKNWIKLPSDRLLEIFNTLIELYDNEPLRGGSFLFNKHHGIHLDKLLNDPRLKWKGDSELKKLNEKLKNFSTINEVEVPKNLKATLRDYQKTGLNWLQFLREYQFNGVLADDMGLGKTIQTLVHLLYEKNHHKPENPTLIIAPTSLMGNWLRETERFAPELNILLLHGLERRENFKLIEQHDVVITTYSLMLRDYDTHKKNHYHYIILDESQNIKNSRSKTTQNIYKLSSNFRLCLTGTPMENHLGELWSMFHFLMPGYLGNLNSFNRLFKNPIEKSNDFERQKLLTSRLKPFMLRRKKEDVAYELPAKTEIIRSIPISGNQRDLYETIRLAMDKKVQTEIGKKGLARSHIMILEALLKLRQICCDPSLLPANMQYQNPCESAKMELLMDLVPEMLMEGRKILIFSQFVKMLAIIEKALTKEGIDYVKLTGQTVKRDEAINAFQNGEVSIFLISLKAGGVGLNLTAADTVIHYDPWWNPAVEKQATDRAHRIGQDKPVFVYKLLTKDTVEEKILNLQNKKQQLADAIYLQKDNQEAVTFTQDDLVQLLEPLR